MRAIANPSANVDSTLKIGKMKFHVMMRSRGPRSDSLVKNWVKFFQPIVARYPEQARGHLLLGRTFLSERRFQEAEAILREAIRVGGPAAHPLRLLGAARAAQGRLEEAVQAWNDWLALSSRPAEEDRHLAAVGRMRDAARALAEGLGGAG